jgi:hypothetical protein
MQMGPLEQQCHISLRQLLLTLSMVRIHVQNFLCLEADT